MLYGDQSPKVCENTHQKLAFNTLIEELDSSYIQLFEDVFNAVINKDIKGYEQNLKNTQGSVRNMSGYISRLEDVVEVLAKATTYRFSGNADNTLFNTTFGSSCGSTPQKGYYKHKEVQKTFNIGTIFAFSDSQINRSREVTKVLNAHVKDLKIDLKQSLEEARRQAEEQEHRKGLLSKAGNRDNLRGLINQANQEQKVKANTKLKIPEVEKENEAPQADKQSQPEQTAGKKRKQLTPRIKDALRKQKLRKTQKKESP